MLQKLKNCFILIIAFAAVCVSAAVKEMKMGVYIYDDHFRKIVKEDGADLKSLVDEHFKLLKEHGVDIPEKDAFRFAQEAARQKMAPAREAAAQRRDNWLYDNILEYR